MRIRATVAAVSGALALSAFVVPAAQAADQAAPADVAGALGAAHSAQHASGVRAGTPYALDASFSNVKINNGKNIAVGTGAVKVPVSFTLTHAADVDIHADDFVAAVDLYRGTSFNDVIYDITSDVATCTDASATVATCKATVQIGQGMLLNEDAGSWKAAAFAVAYNGENPDNPNLDKVGVAVKDPAGSLKMQRVSKLTVNASPEPVAKGKTITVTGKLSRANWEDGKYHGYVGQPVKLQFRKKGTDTYTTVKTVKTNSTGELKTTVKATVDGYFRYSFAGTTTTPAVNATGDFVDVR